MAVDAGDRGDLPHEQFLVRHLEAEEPDASTSTARR
jgi:hypothetical protein